MSAAKPSPKASNDKTTTPDLLVLGFELVAEKGWGGMTFAELAARAGIPMIDVYRQLGSERAMLKALSRRVDEAMLDIDRTELDDLPSRDRVFELVMRRLDALAPFRAGLVRLAKEAGPGPLTMLMTACRLDRSMAWLQEAAGLKRHGLGPRLQRRVLTAIYLQTLRAWSRDDSADLAGTMASLDKALRRLESVAGLSERRRETRPGDEAAQPA
jgi:AcrR family transcriptional regulator